MDDFFANIEYQNHVLGNDPTDPEDSFENKGISDDFFSRGIPTLFRLELCRDCRSGRDCVSDPPCLSKLDDYPLKDGHNVIGWEYDFNIGVLYFGRGPNKVELYNRKRHITIGTDFCLGKTVICQSEGMIKYSATRELRGRYMRGAWYYLDEMGTVSAFLHPRLSLLASAVYYSLFSEDFCSRSILTYYFFDRVFRFSPSDDDVSKVKDMLSQHADFDSFMVLTTEREDKLAMANEERKFEPESTLAGIGKQVKRRILKKNLDRDDKVINVACGRHDLKEIMMSRSEVCFGVDIDLLALQDSITNYNSMLGSQSVPKLTYFIPVLADMRKPLFNSEETAKLHASTFVVPYGSCDLATVFFAFQHFCSSEDEAVCATINIIRSVKPGGKIVLILPDPHRVFQFKSNPQVQIELIDKPVHFEFGQKYKITIPPHYNNLVEFYVPLDKVTSYFERFGCTVIYSELMSNFYSNKRNIHCSTKNQEYAFSSSEIYRVLIFLKKGNKEKVNARKRAPVPVLFENIIRPDQKLDPRSFILFQADGLLSDSMFAKRVADAASVRAPEAGTKKRRSKGGKARKKRVKR